MKIPGIFNKRTDASGSDNAVDFKKTVLDTLISSFRQLRFDESSLNISKVTIWVANPVHISILNNESFVNQLHTEIENNFITSLKNAEILVKMGKPAAKVMASCVVEDSVWFSFTMPKENEASTKKCAKISIAGNRGSLKRKIYDLDTERRTIFHIGRGDAEHNHNRPYRENQIVIDDKEKNKQLLEMNMHVSASHADIIFDNGSYFLKATPYGCRPDGSKTSVIRENADGTEEHEIRDSNSRFRLRSGDMIELGESVLLLFTLTKQS